MKGYVRSFRFWGKVIEKLFLALLGVVMLVFILQIFLGGDKKQVFRMVINYLPMLGMIGSVAVGLNISSYYVPQALSYGSTRKEIGFGVAAMTHLMMLQMGLLAVMCEAFFPDTYVPEGYARICGIIFLICCGVGNGIGAAVLRFGNKAGMVVYIAVIVLFTGGAGVISALDIKEDMFLSLIYGGWIPVVAAVFDLFMVLVYWLGIRKYGLKS